jgi:hypothetical protein
LVAMSTSRAPFPATTALICLAAATLAAGCADQQNPVLPPYTGPTDPGGTLTSGMSDAGPTKLLDAASVGATEDAVGTDALLGTLCDLLAQNCADHRYGCYPVGGQGICERAGIQQALMTCQVDTDCDRGLVCLPIQGLGSQGLCEPICERRGNSVPTICPSQVCAARGPDFPANVGVCSSS